MSGLAVRVDLAGAVREAQQAFEAFGLTRFPRAVPFALTGAAMDAVNSFRAEIPSIWHHPNAATRKAVRYTVDKDLLGRVASVGGRQGSGQLQLESFCALLDRAVVPGAGR